MAQRQQCQVPGMQPGDQSQHVTSHASDAHYTRVLLEVSGPGLPSLDYIGAKRKGPHRAYPPVPGGARVLAGTRVSGSLNWSGSGAGLC